MTTTRRNLISRFALGAAGLAAGASLQALPALAHDGEGRGNKQKIRERRRDRRRDRKQRRRRN